MSEENLQQFWAWYSDRRDLWDAVRLRGIALRTGPRAPWLGARVLLTLEGGLDRQPRIVSTQHAFAFDVRVDADKLPSLLRGLEAGLLERAHVGWSRPTITIADLGCSPSGSDHLASRIRVDARDLGALCRFELDLRRKRPASGAAFIPYEVARRSDRAFLNAGVGSTSAVARLLEMGNADGLMQDDLAAKAVAAIPARISALQQTADRTGMRVQIEARPDLLSRLSLLAVSLDGGLTRPRSIPVTGDDVIVELKNDGPIHFTLLLDRRAVQSEDAKPLPRVRASVRHVAQRAFLEHKPLLRDGLLPPSPKHNDWFERSVTHLLVCLGFAPMWWGRNRGSGSPDDRFPMPDDAADSLAFSSNDAVVAVIECTVDTLGKDKAHRLMQRAARVTKDLRKAFGTSAPTVVPVLAAAVPLDELPRAVRSIVVEDGGVILDRQALENLLDLVETGASDGELRRTLPKQLRSDSAARRMLPIF